MTQHSANGAADSLASRAVVMGSHKWKIEHLMGDGHAVQDFDDKRRGDTVMGRFEFSR
jgi:hypothetical protein